MPAVLGRAGRAALGLVESPGSLGAALGNTRLLVAGEFVLETGALAVSPCVLSGSRRAALGLVKVPVGLGATLGDTCLAVG